MDWTNISKKYRGKWISLSSDEKKVLISGDNLKKIYKETLEKGFKNPILFKVPQEITPFVGRY